MKKKDIELDVDFIGTQDSSLTKEEEKKISDYIQKHKVKTKKSSKKPQGI